MTMSKTGKGNRAMTDYISREGLAEHKFPKIELLGMGEGQAYRQGWNDAIDAIVDNEPSADVVEVRHGHWEHTPTFWIYCSVCGREPNEYNERVNFCPYCGADMRGQSDDE